MAAPTPAWNITDHRPLERVIVQGHRGVGELAEENTVEAFELAWKMGIYPECDLHSLSRSCERERAEDLPLAHARGHNLIHFHP